METTALTISKTSAAAPLTAIGLSGEIISRSQIECEFIWPEDDPRVQAQEVRIFNDEARVMQLSDSQHFDLAVFLEKTKHLDTPSRIMELLNSSAFQFNSRKRFRACDLWRRRIEMACEQSRPIEILIPAFCVISNPTKRIQPTAVTAAEDVSLLHMHRIAMHVKAFYSPGAIFQVVSDSTFYALSLGVTSVESQNYLVKLKQRTHDLKITNTIRIHDISDFLSNHNEFFHTRFEHWRTRFLKDPISTDLSTGEYQRWLTSMRATLNSRRMGFSYKQLALLFCAGSTTSVVQLDECATIALSEYRALKPAAADTQWESLYFPNSIRATIHVKKLPVLGLRLYPDYKIASRLLPYHGIAVVTRDKETQIERMDIRHEITVIGNPDYTRVTSSDGITQFYEKSGSFTGN